VVLPSDKTNKEDTTLNNSPSVSLHLLIYLSQMRGSLSKEEIEKFVALASRKNEEKGITGVLLVLGDHFVQFLEGREKDISELMEVIKMDPRHEGVSVLLTQDIKQRTFTNWGMSSVALRRKELDVYHTDVKVLHKALKKVVEEKGIQKETVVEMLLTIPRILMKHRSSSVDLSTQPSKR